MKINRLNYEIYLVDYLDGKLSASQVDELLLFLDQNLDIKEALEGMEDAVLIAESTSFPNKSSLKKKPFLKDGIDNEFDYLCISATEGLLLADEKIAFEKSLKEDASKLKAYKDFQKTKIAADSVSIYPKKTHLKRTSIIPIRYSYLRASISVAATVTLLLGIYTIGKLVIKETPIENTTIIAESIGISFQEQSIIEIKKPVAVFENHKTAVIKQQAVRNVNNKQILENNQPLISREEYIPSPLKRKKVQHFETQIDPQAKALEEIVKEKNPQQQIILEQLLAQQSKSNNFEAIQNGVKFLGKLIGRDIKLNANKDEKGNVEKITFESKLIAFSTQVKNE